jgi:hypothetical protein
MPAVTAAIDWPAVWVAAAARVAAHRAASRTHLLTEDTVRLETILALGEAGVGPHRLRAEVLAPALAGGKLDLVVDPPAGTVIELKYPRDSRTGISPDTMTLGELVRDFLRVAAVPAQDRWVVQLLNDRLAGYLQAAYHRYGLHWADAPGAPVALPAAAVAALPVTAQQAVGAAAVSATVTGTCVVAKPVGARLTLYAYRVNGLPAEDGVDPIGHAAPRAQSVTPAEPSPVRTARDGARHEILDAARAVVSRGGRAEFTMPEVIAEMRRRGTGYAEATIRTMISAHLCAEVTGVGVAGYADVTRVGRGLYRLTN